MAKTKKNIDTKQSNKMKLEHVKKRNYGYQVRDCVIRLERLSKMEYELYCDSHTIVTKSFDIKLKGNTAKINEKKHHSSNKTFAFELKRHRNEMVLEFNVQPMRKITSRCVKKVETILPQKKEKTNQTTSKPAKSLNVMINDAWKKCKTEFKSSGLLIEQSTVAMAKMSGYSAWPARIDDFTKNGKRARVFFFGSNNIGSVDISEIVPFEFCREVIRLLLRRKVGPFHRSVLEIERILGIPSELSLTTELFSIEN